MRGRRATGVAHCIRQPALSRALLVSWMMVVLSKIVCPASIDMRTKLIGQQIRLRSNKGTRCNYTDLPTRVRNRTIFHQRAKRWHILLQPQ